MDKIKLEADIIVRCNERVKIDSPMLTERFGVVQDQLQHIARIGSNIVLQKAGLREETGFVKAVCDNDLVEAVKKSDFVLQSVMSYIVSVFVIGHSEFTQE